MVKSFCTVLMTTKLESQRIFYTEVLGLKELFNHEQAVGLGNQDQLYIVLRQENNVNSHHQQENKGPIILTFQVAFEDKNTILTRVEQRGCVVRNSLQVKEHNIDYVFIEDCDGNELCLNFNQ